jgi:hypothetical protein
LCDQMRRKDKMIDALLEAIAKMKWGHKKADQQAIGFFVARGWLKR